jgi:hypothetical protein
MKHSSAVIAFNRQPQAYVNCSKYAFGDCSTIGGTVLDLNLSRDLRLLKEIRISASARGSSCPIRIDTWAAVATQIKTDATVKTSEVTVHLGITVLLGIMGCCWLANGSFPLK